MLYVEDSPHMHILKLLFHFSCICIGRLIRLHIIGFKICYSSNRACEFQVTVELENGQKYEGDLLVGADGIWSKVLYTFDWLRSYSLDNNFSDIKVNVIHSIIRYIWACVCLTCYSVLKLFNVILFVACLYNHKFCT
jgi:hypothetical protein